VLNGESSLQEDVLLTSIEHETHSWCTVICSVCHMNMSRQIQYCRLVPNHSSKTGCRSRQSTVNQQLPIQTYIIYCTVSSALCLLPCYASEDFLVVSPQSSLRNILFICLYATSSCLYDLHTFLLHFWRFCLMYGIWPSLLRCLHKSKIYSYLSSRETPTTWLLWFHFCFCGACVFLVLLEYHETGLTFDILAMCNPDLCI